MKSWFEACLGWKENNSKVEKKTFCAHRSSKPKFACYIPYIIYGIIWATSILVANTCIWMKSLWDGDFNYLWKYAFVLKNRHFQFVVSEDKFSARVEADALYLDSWKSKDSEFIFLKLKDCECSKGYCSTLMTFNRQVFIKGHMH